MIINISSYLNSSTFAQNSNINVFVVNWVDANEDSYFQSAANAEFVAQTTASFLSSVQASFCLASEH